MAAARAGNEQISVRAAGSEPDRRRASQSTPEIKCMQYVHFLGSARGARSVVILSVPTDPMGLVLHNSTRVYFSEREIEKFIIRQPPMGEKDDYDSENSWISRRSQD